ncbi:MAG: hypothetical protein Kow00124_17210 [Anaerolineae bacterium]
MQGVRVKSRTPTRDLSPGRSSAPAWLQKLKKDLPPYADEVLAFLLIAIGLLSFLMLLSPSGGQIGGAWSTALRRAFGLGAYIVSGVIMLTGGMLLMPKLGTPVYVNWWRITAGEIFFFFLLAYLHAGIRASVGGEAGRVEAFAQAMEGHGGGMVGWAIQELVHMLLGDMITGLVLLAGIVLSGVMMVGLRRETILGALDDLHQKLLDQAGRLEPQPSPAQAAPADDGAFAPAQPEGSISPPVLPPLPGRPSIVTGAVGSGATGVPGPYHAPGDGSAPQGEHRTLKEQLMESDEVVMRFKLEHRVDRRRARKRSRRLPPIDLLSDTEFGRPSDKEINVNAEIIERTAEDFGMKVQVIGVKAGPTVTQYAVQPFTRDKENGGVVQRVRVTRVAALASDLGLALAARSVRIQAPVPGTNYIGIEVPNPQPGIVSLRPVMESDQFYKIKSPLAIALGREVDGTPFAVDLAKMPHLLIGGTTGSGKSVCLRSIATCLIANNTPDQLRLVMIDPKMVELIRFNGLPHLLGRVEVQMARVIGVLRWVTREMERRYRLMEEAQARNIVVYNQGHKPSQRLPYIVVLIDELAELMTEFPDQTEHLITRLAQMARATGIHLVVATQRPSTDVVTGLIKANFPARISFAVASGTDSRVIIDTVGAEDLIGKGDMLYQGADAAGPIRVQGCFVSDQEMENLVDFWREHWEWDEDEEAPWERSLTHTAILEATDPMLIEAARIVQKDRVASASLLQRRLNVGYPRAGRIIDSLYRLKVVGPEQSGGRLREVLIPPDVDAAEYIVEQQTSHRFK